MKIIMRQRLLISTLLKFPKKNKISRNLLRIINQEEISDLRSKRENLKRFLIARATIVLYPVMK